MVTATSLEAFAAVPIGKRQEQVLDAITELGQCCDQDIAAHLRWTINRITPRRGELFNLGLVKCIGTKTGPTGRTVMVWAVNF